MQCLWPTLTHCLASLTCAMMGTDGYRWTALDEGEAKAVKRAKREQATSSASSAHQVLAPDCSGYSLQTPNHRDPQAQVI